MIGIPAQMLARGARQAHAQQYRCRRGAVADERPSVIARTRLHRRTRLVDQHVCGLCAQHVDERRIREGEPDAAYSRVPLLLDARGDSIERRCRVCLIHGISAIRGRSHARWRIAQREGEDHVALGAGLKVYIIDERGSCQSITVLRTETVWYVAVGHVARDLVLAMKAEWCRAPRNRGRERGQKGATIDVHGGARKRSPDLYRAYRGNATVLPRRVDLHPA